MAFAVNAFNATNRDGLSVHLHDEIIYLIVLLELTKTIIGQGSDDMVLGQLYMSARAHIRYIPFANH